MRWAFTIMAAAMLTAVAALWALAGDQSSPALNAVPGYTPVTQVTSWKVLFRSSQADGSAVVNPVSWSGWAAAARESSAYADAAATPYVGGRLLLSTRAGAEFQIWALFTTAGASAQMQLFGFDGVRVALVASADQSAIVTPGADTTIGLGLAYPIAQDAGLRTFSALATADAVKIKFNGAAVYPHESGGTTYYAAPMIRDDWDYYGVLPYVTSISGGTLVLVGRTR